MNVTIWKKIHNYVGLLSSIFLAVLLVTGILLNHPDWMKNDRATVVAQDPDDAQKSYMGKKDGLYVTTDGGKTWEEVSMLFPPQDVADIAFSPNQPRGIYVLEKWGKIFHAKDGKIWDNRAVPFDPQASGIELKKISIGSRNEVCVFTSNGWVRSMDGGQTWDAAAFDEKKMPLHRLVLSLHNGYFFGPRFVILYDLAAAGLLILILTGFVLWKTGRKIG